MVRYHRHAFGWGFNHKTNTTHRYKLRCAWVCSKTLRGWVSSGQVGMGIFSPAWWSYKYRHRVDDIAIEPETRKNPTHNASTQTPCFKTDFIRTPFIHFFTSQKIKERTYFPAPQSIMLFFPDLLFIFFLKTQNRPRRPYVTVSIPFCQFSTVSLYLGGAGATITS